MVKLCFCNRLYMFQDWTGVSCKKIQLQITATILVYNLPIRRIQINLLAQPVSKFLQAIHMPSWGLPVRVKYRFPRIRYPA